MGRFWSFLFLLVPILGTLAFVWAAFEIPPLEGHWLPEDVSEHGAAIDHLFNLILILTGVVFIGTGLVLAFLMWKYGEHQQRECAECVHGSKKLELTWSLIPGAILVFLSFYQINVWEDRKMNRPTETVDGVETFKPPFARVTARQFGWEFQYAGPDRKLDTADDFHSQVPILMVPEGEEIVVAIESRDVLHSFFIPNLRLKQDIVPGMVQYCWFVATKPGEYDIACTELCGWGHYKMRGQLQVFSKADFEKEYKQAVELANRGSD